MTESHTSDVLWARLNSSCLPLRRDQVVAALRCRPRCPRRHPIHLEDGHPHIVVDSGGIIFALTLTATNKYDSIQFEDFVAALPAVKQPYGFQRKRPDKANANKANDMPRYRTFVSGRGSNVHIARNGVDSASNWARLAGWLGAPSPGYLPSDA